MITEEIRSYEVSVWTLLDEFLTVLKWSDAEQKGRIENPKMILNIDGTLEFTFSIPMYYYKNGKLIDNPNWYNIENGNLIEGLRKIKVIFNKDELSALPASDFAREASSHVFEFLIINMEDSHEKDVASCEVKCEGLAFHELGKLGYKISLSLENFEVKYKKWAESNQSTPEPVLTIDYWCGDETTCHLPVRYENTSIVDPNKWYYTVRMNLKSFKNHSGITIRSSAKIYEEPFPTQWSTELIPGGYIDYKEKARVVTADKSNLYNLTQTIAEAFLVHCKYEYTYDENYHITSRTIVFYNHFFQEEKGAMSFTYPYSSSKITRTSDCSNLTTKMYVLTTDNNKTVAGYNTIMNASTNPTHEDYILNFDYMLDRGIISLDLYDDILPYLKAMRDYNDELIMLLLNLDTYNMLKPEIEGKISVYKKSIEIDEENKNKNVKLANELDILDGTADGYITIDNSNPDPRMVMQDEEGRNYISLLSTNKGIDKESVRIYQSYSSATHTLSEEIPSNNFIFDYDAYKNPSKIYGITPKVNSNSVYLIYRYKPRLYYDAIAAVWDAKLGNDKSELAKQEELLGTINKDTGIGTGLLKLIYDAEQRKDILIKEKNDTIAEFNRRMGAALRESYWQPEDYLDYGINKEGTEQLKISNIDVDAIKADAKEGFIVGWDTELFDEEDKNYYEESVNLNKIYYPCIDLSPIYDTIKNNILDYKFIFNNNYVSTKDNSNNIINLYDRRYTQVFSIGSGALLQFGLKDGVVYPLLVLVAAKSMSLSEIDFLTHETIILNDVSRYAGRPRIGLIVQEPDGTYNININSCRPVKSTYDSNYPFFVDGSLYTTVQPRIKFSSLNLRANSTDFVIKYNNVLLEIAKDYIILTRNTLRLVEKNGTMVDLYYPEYFLTIHSDTIYKCGILNGNFNIHYILSNADNLIYLDALEVMKENAYPKVEYAVEPNILDSNLSKTLYLKLATLVMINDTKLKLENAFGYISKVELDLDNITKDLVEVKNYKNKFEDLFSTIVALTELMKLDGAKFHAAAEGYVALQGDALKETLTLLGLVLLAYLDSYFDSSQVVKDRLTSLFTEAGEILSDSNKSLNLMRALTLENADILSGFVGNIANELTTKVYRQSTKPSNYKPGDIWIDNNDNRYVATSYSNEGDASGTSGFVRTRDGTLASITGASIDINADDGIINIEAENEINIKSGNNVYIAANDMVEIIGNNKVNIGGTEINLCSLAEKKLNPLTGLFEYILDDNNHQIIHTTTGINLIAGEYLASGNYGTTARVLIKPTKIEIGASELLLKAASKMNLITSLGATNNTSAVHISAEDGIWIGTGTSLGVRLFSGEVKLNSNGTVDTTVTSATGASVELNAEHLILGYANTQSNSATAIEMNDTFVIIAAGDLITGNKTTDNNKIITGTTGSLIGAKFTKESIGFAVGSGANISAILMNGTNGITIGSGSIDVTASSSDLRAVQNGSYVRIGSGGVELGSFADLYINTDNFKLLTHSRDKGNTGYIDGNTLLALGKGLLEIGYTTSLADIRTKNTRLNNPTLARLVINDNGAYFEGDVYANNGYFNGEVNATSFVGIGENGKFIADPTRFGLYQSDGSTVILAADANGNLTAGGDLTISAGKSLSLNVTSAGTININSNNFKVDSSATGTNAIFYVGTGGITSSDKYIKYSLTNGLEVQGGITATTLAVGSGSIMSYDSTNGLVIGSGTNKLEYKNSLLSITGGITANTLSVGNGDNLLTYDSTNGLIVKGNITANSGTIGSWKVGDNLLTHEDGTTQLVTSLLTGGTTFGRVSLVGLEPNSYNTDDNAWINLNHWYIYAGADWPEDAPGYGLYSTPGPLNSDVSKRAIGWAPFRVKRNGETYIKTLCLGNGPSSLYADECSDISWEGYTGDLYLWLECTLDDSTVYKWVKITAQRLYSAIVRAESASGCFVAGTLVNLPDGKKIPIEQITVGTTILAYDLVTLTFVPGEVGVMLRFKHRDCIYDLYLSSGKIITVTHSHPFLTTDGWKALNIDAAWRDHHVKTKLLLEHDELINNLNEHIYIEKIQYRYDLLDETVYHCSIDKYHTFLVEDVVVHNVYVAPDLGFIGGVIDNDLPANTEGNGISAVGSVPVATPK